MSAVQINTRFPRSTVHAVTEVSFTPALAPAMTDFTVGQLAIADIAMYWPTSVTWRLDKVERTETEDAHSVRLTFTRN